MPQIVGKDLCRRHTSLGAEALHLRPDLFSGQALPASGEKDLTGGDLIFPCVFQQLPAESAREQNGADLSLERNLCPPLPRGLHRDAADLADPNARRTDGLQHQGQSHSSQCAGGTEQAVIFPLRQLPARISKQPPLDPQELQPAVLPPQKEAPALR